MDVQPLDCAMCGLPTCAEFAIAVCRGETTWAACLPHRSSVLSSEIEGLGASASLDPVTGLSNRQVLEQRLVEEFARHERSGGRLSLLLLGVDRLESVNDRFGRAIGDAVLARVAELLRASLRAADVPVHYDGDEFAVVLPDTSKTEAFAVAEKLRLEIEEAVLDAEGPAGDPVAFEVSVSIGVSTAHGGAGSPESLLEAADRALHRAKESGRNQVRLAPG
jgi:diguanylate cyclase (GGDEF)-like protein